MEQIDLLNTGVPGAVQSDWAASVHDVGPLASWPTDRVERAAAEGSAPWILFWDPDLGAPDPDLLGELQAGGGDVYHAGLKLGLRGLPDDLDLIHPTSWLTIDPWEIHPASSWRVSLRATLIRRRVFETVGGLDNAFRTSVGVGLDLGYRLIRRGAIVIHDPRLVGQIVTESITLDSTDRYLFLFRHYRAQWVRYAMLRRSIGRISLAERRAFRAAELTVRRTAPPEAALVERPRSQRPATDRPMISVIIPTLGRYEMLRDVLTQVGRQTVRPDEVICVDQNGPSLRRPDVYEIEGLNVQVVFQDGKGQWLARNEAIRRSSGELLVFLDDDSTIGSDFIEQHLEGLQRYQADLSTGASLAVVGAPVPPHYSHFHIATQFDTGNGMCTRALMRRIGAYDRHYDRMRAGDADFGLRATRAGALVIHNPHAVRIHHKAAEGGLRMFGSWDTFKEKGLLSPLPTPSVLYYGYRHFTPRQVREFVLIGLASAAIPYERKSQLHGRDYLGVAALTVVSSPLTLVRHLRSRRQARRMIERGPLIPNVD